MVYCKYGSGGKWNKGGHWFTFEFDVIRIRPAVGGTAPKKHAKIRQSTKASKQASTHLQSEREQKKVES